MTQGIRVRALQALVVHDDGKTLRMVPKGMTGTLVGCLGTQLAPASPGPVLRNDQFFLVVWDHHVVGASCGKDVETSEFLVCNGDFPTWTRPNCVEAVPDLPAQWWV